VFRNRKGFISQNVLGVVDFDLCFTYVLVGWEGSAHDGRVLLDAITKGLSIPPGKYYLGDAGYALTLYCLTTRYHLKEWRNAPNCPENARELFNLRHASLRNAIERAFGIIKKRFPILVTMPSYPFRLQMQLVKCCFMIHNFLCWPCLKRLEQLEAGQVEQEVQQFPEHSFQLLSYPENLTQQII